MRYGRRPRGSYGWGYINDREQWILQMLADGHVPKKIAIKGNMSLRAVWQAMYQLRNKVRTRTTWETIAVGLRKGYIK